MREGGVAVGDCRNSKGSYVRRKKRERVGSAKGAKGVGNRISRKAGIAWTGVEFIGNAGKRRQAAKLQIERAIFDVVEDAEAATHHNLAGTEHVPGESEARGKIVVVGINESAIGSAGIAGVQDALRRVREDGGLLPGEEAQDLVVNIVLGNVVIPTQAVIQGEVCSHFKGILRIQTDGASTDAVNRSGFLVIIVPEAADKVGLIAAGKGRLVASKIKAAVVVIVVVEIQLQASKVRAEFEFVFAAGPGNVIGPLKGVVVQPGGTLHGRAEIEIGSKDARGRDACGVVGVQIGKAECGWRGLVRRNRLVSGGAIGAEAKFIGHGWRKDVDPREGANLISEIGAIGAADG